MTAASTLQSRMKLALEPIVTGANLFKISTVSKFAIRLIALGGLAFVLGWRPEFGEVIRGPQSVGGVSQDEPGSIANTVTSISPNEETCTPIRERERAEMRRDAGVDLAKFIEDSTRALHGARSSEEQLKVVATRFDHRHWSKAWMPEESSVSNNPELLKALRLQTNLSHATLFLSRYHRVIENGLRQESSALRAFYWKDDAREELRREPMRALVRSYLPHTCLGSDQIQYGCQRGETIYRVRAILSPRIACRFREKIGQYAAVFWVRVPPEGAQILEVEVNGQRIVKMTYDELVHKRMMSALAPNVSEVLLNAGLDPFRAPVLWRRWLRDRDEGRMPASN